MSPEQLAATGGEPDLRTDVYALGVILYELLTGRPPYELPQGPLVTMVAAAREAEPRYPQGLPADLAWILMRSLEREPSRRYASAASLAEDLRRYLEHEPVLAGPPSVSYRLRKLARRHRVLLTSIVGVIAALSIGLVLATTEAARARQEADKSAEIIRFLRKTLTSIDPIRAGEEARVVDLLENAARERALRGPRAEDEATAVLDQIIGEGYLGLREFPEAERHVAAAVEYVERALAPSDPFALDVRATQAHLLFVSGQRESAESLARELEPEARAALGPEHETTLKIGMTLAELWLWAPNRDPVRAEALFDDLLARLLELRGPDDTDYLGVRGGRAILLRQLGRSDEALEEFEFLVQRCLGVFGDDHFRVQNAKLNLATHYQELGEHERAVAMYAEILEYVVRHQGPRHAFVALLEASLATSYQALERYEVALEHWRRSVSLSREVYGPDRAISVNCVCDLAACQEKAGSPAEAGETLRSAWSHVPAESWGGDVDPLVRALFARMRAEERDDEARALVEGYRARCGAESSSHALCGELLRRARRLGRVAQSKEGRKLAGSLAGPRLFGPRAAVELRESSGRAAFLSRTRTDLTGQDRRIMKVRTSNNGHCTPLRRALTLGTLALASLTAPTHAQVDAGEGDAPAADASLERAIQHALGDDYYEAVWQVGTPFADVDATYQAPNKAENLRTFFLQDGVRIVPRTTGADDWMLSLSLRSLTRGAEARTVGAGEVVAEGERVEVRRAGVTEWYVNDERGLEQGFDLAERFGDADAPLELLLDVDGELELDSVSPDRARLLERTGRREPGARGAVHPRRRRQVPADPLRAARRGPRDRGRGRRGAVPDLDRPHDRERELPSSSSRVRPRTASLVRRSTSSAPARSSARPATTTPTSSSRSRASGRSSRSSRASSRSRAARTATTSRSRRTTCSSRPRTSASTGCRSRAACTRTSGAASTGSTTTTSRPRRPSSKASSATASTRPVRA